MLLEVALQHEAENGCALAVTGDDERAATVVVLEVVVEGIGNVSVGYVPERLIDVTSLHPYFSRVLHARLVVEWDKQVGGFLEHARLDGMFNLYTIQHLGVVELRIVGVAFACTHIHCRIDVERVELLGYFRNLVPVGLLGIVDSIGILRVHRNWFVLIATA